MAASNRKTLNLMNQALYIISIALLISGLALSFSPQAVQASEEPLSTTNGCSATAQKIHLYAVGDPVYIQYNKMGAGSHPWEIRYNNKTGRPIVSVISNPAILGTGTVPGDSGCFEAWIVQPEEAGYVFKVEMGGKQHTYQVAALPTATTTPPADSDSTEDPTPTDPTPEVTTPAPTDPTPTVTTPAPTDPTPTVPTPTLPTPVVTTPAPDDPTTSPTPTADTPTPGVFLLTTFVPTTPAPTTPAPTDPPAGSPQTESTPAPADPTEVPSSDVTDEPSSPAPNPGQSVAAIASLPIPPAGDQNMLAPVTGADKGASSTARAAGRELCMVGLAVLGLAMMISGTRSSFCGGRS